MFSEAPVTVIADYDEGWALFDVYHSTTFTNLHLKREGIAARGGTITIQDCTFEHDEALCMLVDPGVTCHCIRCRFFDPSGPAIIWLTDKDNGELTLTGCQVVADTGIEISDGFFRKKSSLTAAGFSRNSPSTSFWTTLNCSPEKWKSETRFCLQPNPHFCCTSKTRRHLMPSTDDSS